MTITITTINNQEVRINNIREMSHSKDGMLIFVPYCGASTILVNDNPILISELPSVDVRIIRSIRVKL